jgi:hypothetical protein
MGCDARLQPENNYAPARRKKMLMHLAIAIVTSLPLTPIADKVPKFDIARECRSEGGSKAALEKCAEDEANAREQLQTQWSQFGVTDKAACIRETSMDSTPSYVELLTCLEMARDARKSSK